MAFWFQAPRGTGTAAPRVPAQLCAGWVPSAARGPGACALGVAVKFLIKDVTTVRVWPMANLWGSYLFCLINRGKKRLSFALDLLRRAEKVGLPWTSGKNGAES